MRIPAPLLKHAWTSSLKCLSFELCWTYEFSFNACQSVKVDASTIEKHNRYVTHQDGRRCTNMQLFAAVVNTYGKVGKEFVDFCYIVDSSNSTM